jgi:hypothetical protein
LGIEKDFSSFSKPDKLDEFQKHLDNLLSKSIGNRFHRSLHITFPNLAAKTVCKIVVEPSSEPVYMIDENGKETFYIRRLASTIDLKLSEATKYIQEHWQR